MDAAQEQGNFVEKCSLSGSNANRVNLSTLNMRLYHASNELNMKTDTKNFVICSCVMTKGTKGMKEMSRQLSTATIQRVVHPFAF